jgi:hypothetical protein
MEFKTALYLNEAFYFLTDELVPYI